ncbi:MAG TPA: alcohol dehydrogenase catalytic domain-containing protein, partial [Candidatus Synoicihabitans sp.]|nr:alcohol dehydrogenase catalytic domain-containing protein [Candidatus Synoicihabitans sp.]
MRAFRLDGVGNPLKRVEEADPLAGAGQVVIDIKATTLNYRDLIVQEGRYASHQKPDLIPLSDGAGVISAVGEGVARDRIGQRVTLAFMPGWLEGSFSAHKQSSALGGGFVDGVLAERVVVPSGAALQFPDD